MVTEEQKKNCQNVGLDLTGGDNTNMEWVSGDILHFKINNTDENRKSKTYNRSNYIKTKFFEFIKNL